MTPSSHRTPSAGHHAQEAQEQGATTEHGAIHAASAAAPATAAATRLLNLAQRAPHLEGPCPPGAQGRRAHRALAGRGGRRPTVRAYGAGSGRAFSVCVAREHECSASGVEKMRCASVGVSPLISSLSLYDKRKESAALSCIFSIDRSMYTTHYTILYNRLVLFN